METNAAYQLTPLCPTCQSILLYETPHVYVIHKAWEQTFDVFKHALENKCTICLVVWHMSRQYRYKWVESPETWSPFTFYASKERGEKEIIILKVSHINPLTDGSVVEARFRLIPVDGLLNPEADRNIADLPASDSRYVQQLDQPLLESTISLDAASSIALSWLNLCQISHSECDGTYSPPQKWYPTRLLDIGKEGSATWRLCVTSKDVISSPPASYLTLSYRWGPNPQTQLLSSNIASLRRGQPIANLPTLFQEVIHVARKLSIRYVWIDALCIIQDSKEDWELEAPAMKHVYANSICTLAASGSESPNDTLLHDRELEFVKIGQVQCSLWLDKPQTFYIYDESYFSRQISDGPLHNRGWVFQERFLSTRVLYFGRHQLLWECRTAHRCEMFPKGIPYYWSDKEINSFIRQERAKDRKISWRAYNLWRNLIESYSNCDLTMASDKLFAMSGIAKLFEEVTGDEYLAGLWKSRFAELLDWRVLSPKPLRSLEYRAPSWSWASIDGLVTSPGLSNQGKLLAELISASVVTQTSDRMSAVRSASAVVKARIIPAIFNQVKKQFADIQTPSGQFRTFVYLDTADKELVSGEQISYLPLKLDYSYPPTGTNIPDPYVVCLLLARDAQPPQSSNRYYRMGHFIINEQNTDSRLELFYSSGVPSVLEIV